MKHLKTQVNPLEGSILKGMTLFALPIMATAFLQMLFSSVDTMVIGKFGSENAMASVGACGSVINLIVTGVTALNAGVSITVGHRYGSGKTGELRPVLQSLPLTGAVLGLLVAVLVNLFCFPLLRLVRCPENLLAQAGIYFSIYFWSVPFMMVFSFLSAVLQAKGESVLPFVIQILCGAGNLMLNLLFVIVLKWDAAGVAIATVISQAVSAGLMLAYFVLFEKELPLKLRELTVFRNLGSVFRLGIPTALEGIVMNLSGVVIQAAINGFPETVIAGNTVASSIEGLMCVAFVGFASASVVYISQNYGKEDFGRVKKIHRTTAVLVFALGEALGFLVFLFSDSLIGLYTDSAQIAKIAKLRMLFVCLSYGLCGTMNSLSGCIQGLGDTRTPLKISLLTSCGFRIFWIVAVAGRIGSISAIYVSYPLCWGMTSILYLIAFRRVFRAKCRPEAKEFIGNSLAK